jgi:ADP-heptose:LPS heptosyltransferase
VTPYAVLHPGTARAEKNWELDHWLEIKRHLLAAHGLRSVFTAGPDPKERADALKLFESPEHEPASLSSAWMQPPDLCAFAALLRDAELVVSCDTAAVHLAAAFQRPQVALFGPTNPFHWRPRHERAVVISAAHPDAPMTTFDPHMKGAPMERISTRVVCDAIDALLA